MRADQLARLEELGELGALRAVAAGEFGQPGSPVHAEVELWLRAKRAACEAESATMRDARESESIAIAKRALSVAMEANRFASSTDRAVREQARWAKWAAIIATIAIVIATKDQIFALIF